MKTQRRLLLTGSLASLLVAGAIPVQAVQSTASHTLTAERVVDINFLNPSSFANNGQSVISTMDDGWVGSPAGTYHLSAWITETPANARVEFFYEIEGPGGTTRGNPIPGVDIIVEKKPPYGLMFEADWTIPDEIPEFNSETGETGFSLITVLYSGDAEYARDTQTLVQKNDSSPGDRNHPEDNQARANTASLVDPVNGSELHFSTPAGGRPQAVITVGTVNDAPSEAYYTVTSFGESPVWKGCGADFNNDGKLETCTLAEGDEVHEVTAVGVNAVGATPGSGDVAAIVPVADTLTNLTAKNDVKFVRGVAHTEEECQPGRIVTLFQARKGRDRVVGKDTTDSLGRWGIKVGKGTLVLSGNAGKATVYAVVAVSTSTDTQSGGQLSCLPDESKKVRRNYDPWTAQVPQEG